MLASSSIFYARGIVNRFLFAKRIRKNWRPNTKILEIKNFQSRIAASDENYK